MDGRQFASDEQASYDLWDGCLPLHCLRKEIRASTHCLSQLLGHQVLGYFCHLGRTWLRGCSFPLQWNDKGM